MKNHIISLKISILRILSLVCILFGFQASYAQMTVGNQQTVQWYVENVLLGSGVTASNITFNGQPGNTANLQCGYFQSNGSYMDLASGMVLSTGAVTTVDFAGDSVIVGEQTTLSVTNGMGGDSDLEQLSGETINDQAILEFDFIPTGDTLRFNYIFGSEEYPEYVNSFNDAFGFFISGPGITGAFSSPAGFPGGSRNIAVIPGTTIPVTIDNVNNGNGDCFTGGPTGPCTNCEFYIDNCDIESEAMDGQTTILEAFALVQCGETYHIKLAIGDALDGSFDSAVFLEEGSFASDLVVSASLFSSIGPFIDGFLYENCGFGTIEFIRSGGIEDESLVELEVSGVGENGVDFTTIPSSFTFPAGDSIFYLDIYAYLDGIDEGLEEVTVTITNTSTSACASGSITSEFSFFVSDDPEPLVVSTSNFDIDCGESQEINVEVSGGYGQYVYEWSNGADSQQQIVSPGTTTEYFVTVSDTCNAGQQSASVLVTVPVYPPVVVDLPDNLDLTCLEVVDITADEVSGGDGTYSYEWSQGDGTIIGGDDPVLTYVGSTNGVLTLTVTDGCYESESDIINVTVPVIPMVITTSPDTVICLGDLAEISASVSGGEPPYQFSWSQYNSDQESIIVAPLVTTVYEISVSDLCQNTEMNQVRVHVSESTALFAMKEQGYYGVEMENFSEGFGNDTLIYVWDMGDGTFYTSENVVHDYFDLNDHVITLYVSNEYGCTDSASVAVNGPPSLYIPNGFTPNDDGINDFFRVSAEGVVEFRLMIFDRWGAVVFESNDPNEAWNGRGKNNENFYSENGNYVYYVKARMEDGERVDKRGIVTLFR